MGHCQLHGPRSVSCAALALSWCLRSGLPIQTTPSQGLHVRSLTGLVDGRRLGQMNWMHPSHLVTALFVPTTCPTEFGEPISSQRRICHLTIIIRAERNLLGPASRDDQLSLFLPSGVSSSDMCLGGRKPVFSPLEVYCIVSYRNRTIRYGTEYPYLTAQFMAHTCVSP